jgi:hypothetical protein
VVAAPTATGADDLALALSRVVELHSQNALTDEEFAAAKRQILGLDAP